MGNKWLFLNFLFLLFLVPGGLVVLNSNNSESVTSIFPIIPPENSRISFSYSEYAPPDFGLTPIPPEWTIHHGETITTGVFITATDTFSNWVSLSLSGLPLGVKGDLMTNPAPPNSLVEISLSCSITAQIGTYPITILGVSNIVSGTISETITHTVQVPLSILTTTTSTPTPTQTQTKTASPTITQTPTITNTPTKTPTKTPSKLYFALIKYDPSPTPTPTNTLTPTQTRTSTPTYTNTPSPTPTPTITPTPTPTSIPKGVYILDNHSYFITSWGSLHISGEVWNNSQYYLSFVKIPANLFNSKGELVDTDYTYTPLDNLPPGEKTCFELIFLDPPMDWAYYVFENPTYWTDGSPLPNLTILNNSGEYDPYTGYYEILGLVRNDHGSRVEYVSPVATIYNAYGKAVGCDYTYVNSTHLDPGQISAFDITFMWRDYSDVVSYQLQVDGDPQ